MVTRCSILAWKILWTDEHVGYSPWDCKESDTTEHACICFLNWHFLWNNTLLCTGWWFAQETVKLKSSCYTTSFPLRVHFVSYFLHASFAFHSSINSTLDIVSLSCFRFYYVLLSPIFTKKKLSFFLCDAISFEVKLGIKKPVLSIS